MKPSVKKLRKFFRLEAERGYDNKAVMGGLSNILSSWELEARDDELPEQLIQAVITRLRDYHRLSEDSREVALKGVWQRLTRETGFGEDQELPADSQAQPAPAREPAPQEPQAPQEISPAEADSPDQEQEPAESPAQEETPPPERPSSPPPPAPEPPPDLDYQAALDTIPGIGAKKQAALERMGIHTINDLLYTFPRRHDDYSQLKPISK
ncbi:MAG: hypothetical protein AB8I40_07750, partial [Anaerolineales bacterium]